MISIYHDPAVDHDHLEDYDQVLDQIILRIMIMTMVTGAAVPVAE